MRKFLALALTVLMLTTLFAGATAEVTLTSSMFMTAEYLPEESTMDEETGAYHEVLTYDDGMMRIDLVGQPIPADGSEIPFEEFLIASIGEVTEAEMIEIEPISGYPAQCLRGKLGKSEDTWVVEAVYVPTDAMNFLFAISAPASAYYGDMDGYEAGDVQEIFGWWVDSLEVFDDAQEGEDGLGDLMGEDAGWEEEAMVPAIEDGLVTTEFFTIQLPETWEGRYECEIIPDEPAGYSLNFYDMENGDCFFAIDAVWFDDVPLELGEGETYLGRIDVVRLGSLELAAYTEEESAFAPDLEGVIASMQLAEGCSFVND